MSATDLLPPTPPWKKKLLYAMFFAIGGVCLLATFAWGWVKGGDAIQGIHYAVSFSLIIFIAWITFYICIIRPRTSNSTVNNTTTGAGGGGGERADTISEHIPFQTLPSYGEATLEPPSYEASVKFMELQVCQLEADTREDLEKGQISENAQVRVQISPT